MTIFVDWIFTCRLGDLVLGRLGLGVGGVLAGALLGSLPLLDVEMGQEVSPWTGVSSVTLTIEEVSALDGFQAIQDILDIQLRELARMGASLVITR